MALKDHALINRISWIFLSDNVYTFFIFVHWKTKQKMYYLFQNFTVLILKKNHFPNILFLIKMKQKWNWPEKKRKGLLQLTKLSLKILTGGICAWNLGWSRIWRQIRKPQSNCKIFTALNYTRIESQMYYFLTKNSDQNLKSKILIPKPF